MRFVDGCTIMRATPVVVPPRPLYKSRAQCDGVNGVLLSHLLQVSDKIPTTPFPSMVVAYAFVFFFSLCVVVVVVVVL